MAERHFVLKTYLTKKLRRVEKYLEEEVKHVENDTSFPVRPGLAEAYETTRDVEKMIAGIYS